MSVPAGWFPDESNPGRDRYWDGLKWTDETRDSAESGPKPPPPQVTTSPNGANETLLLKMAEPDFLTAIDHLSDRPLTYQALIAFHHVEKDLCYRAQRLADVTGNLQQPDHNQRFASVDATKAIQAVIWAFERFYTTTYTPILNQLGEAMSADFNTLMQEMGGSTLLPVPIEQAWESYSRPVKALIDHMDEERRPYLELFERIRDQYTS